jgi:hypothetical protein
MEYAISFLCDKVNYELRFPIWFIDGDLRGAFLSFSAVSNGLQLLFSVRPWFFFGTGA